MLPIAAASRPPDVTTCFAFCTAGSLLAPNDDGDEDADAATAEEWVEELHKQHVTKLRREFEQYDTVGGMGKGTHLNVVPRDGVIRVNKGPVGPADPQPRRDDPNWPPNIKRTIRKPRGGDFHPGRPSVRTGRSGVGSLPSPDPRPISRRGRPRRGENGKLGYDQTTGAPHDQ